MASAQAIRAEEKEKEEKWEREKAFPYYKSFPDGVFGEWYRLSERGEFTDQIGNYIVSCPKRAVDENWPFSQLLEWLDSHLEEFGCEE